MEVGPGNHKKGQEEQEIFLLILKGMENIIEQREEEERKDEGTKAKSRVDNKGSQKNNSQGKINIDFFLAHNSKKNEEGERGNKGFEEN